MAAPPEAASLSAGLTREVLYESETTRIYRLRSPTTEASVICKEPLGANALERLRHESSIIARLAGIEGAARLAEAQHAANAMALEDCAGVPLTQILRSEALDLPALLALALQLAQTASAMHRAGVLHQNITPDNILLCGEQRQPMLIDFHLATTFTEEQPGFTHHHQIAGTLAYLAPEQSGRTGRSVDQRADLYALGATFYEMATGRPPFVQSDTLQLIHDHLLHIPTSPVALNPKLPPILSDIILRLLEKEPEQRYQSAEGLAHDLSQIIERLARGENTPFTLGQRDFAWRLAPPSRLVGRDTEISALQTALENTQRGQARGVLVAGAPGVGKTALINELRPMVTARRGWFVSGKFDQYRQDAPTATVQALRALGRLLLAEPPVELALQRSRILAALGPNAGLACELPEFALLLGPQPEVATIDPTQAEARLLLNTVQLLRAIVSSARPLVMVLDDLQWASPGSIRFIDTVLSDTSLPGLLLVGAYRTAEVDATHPLSAMLVRWAKLDSAPLKLQLQNLPPADVGTLLGEMLRLAPTPAAHLAKTLSANTNGNPFDTVELVNALRRDGALVPGKDGWYWEAATIRRYIGHGNVVDLLTARMALLPPTSQQLLTIMACLGGGLGLGLDLLQAASGLSAQTLQEQLLAPLDDRLLVLEPGDESTVQFRHNRVQQAAYDAQEPAVRQLLQLALARRLHVYPEFSRVAAEQFLAVLTEIHEPEECRRVADLFSETAAQARRAANYAAMERLLAAAVGLLNGLDTVADKRLFATLEIEHHAALYSLGRLDEADGVYRAIEAHGCDALVLVDAAGVQVSSLNIRGRRREAVDLGLRLLRQLGLNPPPPSTAGGIHQSLDAVHQWMAQYDLSFDRARPEVSDPRVVAAAQVINQLQVPAFYCDTPIAVWAIQESQRLWAEHGPCATLVANFGRVALVSISINQDYRTSSETLRHVLAAGEAHGYEPQTSQVRHLFAVSAGHWFEPLEDCVAQAQRAREGLLLGGDLLNACTSYHATLRALLECGPTLDAYAAEIDSGLAFAARIGNEQARAVMVPDRQLLRALRGETDVPSSLTDGGIDQMDYLDSLASHPVALATFHVRRSLGAALFADTPNLQRHAAQLMPLMSFIQSFYIAALAHLLRALAQAERVKAAPAEERQAPLAELDACRQWLAERATDAPANFLHLLKWIEAERAWAVHDFQTAACMFDTALREVATRQRPWHRALMTERAALFNLAHGLEHHGQQLLAQARDLYAAWGASGKVHAMQRSHPFLRGLHSTEHERDRHSSISSGSHDSINVSVDSIDMLAILRTSQALSSETSLDSLKSSVVKLLGTMTGATRVCFVLQHEDQKHWQLCAISDQQMVPLLVEVAGSLLPLSAFHYAERTREPLLVEDATRDDRFARDPYIAGLERCSLLVIPILSHGVPRAMLLMENTLSRGAFAADRLDAVMLIAGQLAVSLENALLYDKLEQRVQQRTRELRETQAELLSAARLAGMAEIATNVLHNVGNVLNSVNVSADVIRAQLRTSKLKGLARAVGLMDEHASDLGEFVTQDARGKLLPGYLRELAQTLNGEHEAMGRELTMLGNSVDHIKQVVATQQSYAGAPRMVEAVRLSDLVDDALRMNAQALTRHKVDVVTHLAELPVLLLDRHRMLQILVNLIGNAKQAMNGASEQNPCITLGSCLLEGPLLRITVADNGEGIEPQNLTRVFAHGFTTRKEGHGFGLHSCVLAAKEMGGSLVAQSEGAGRGATFTLEIPVELQDTP